ncbi:MAG: hypothetical protein GY749_50650 [Desulfobacteraceae bacterium]|nr:hypothetical protein [Desulfobacteraceae bacterium]
MASKKKDIWSVRSWRIYPAVCLLMIIVLLGGYFSTIKKDTNHYINEPADSMTQEKSSKAQPVLPLTAVAPTPPEINVTVEEGPERRFEQLKTDPAPQFKKEVRLPKDVAKSESPPQWTKPLAMPVIPREAPDPFTAPPIKVNPERIPQPDVPRLSVGVKITSTQPEKHIK